MLKKVLESALNVIKNDINGESGGGEETNKIEEVMDSLITSLDTIANNNTVSQGEALAVQLMQSFVATVAGAFDENSEEININELVSEAYSISVIASAITPTIKIDFGDIINAFMSGMGSSGDENSSFNQN